jgi:arsenate reductase (thioredoxin)
MAQGLADTSRPTVLFLSTGDSARSPMARGLLLARAADRFEVFSAGTHPRPLSPDATDVMAELGIDISGHRSKDVSEYLGKVFVDHLITVCDLANATLPIFPGARHRLHWSTEDPSMALGSYLERLGAHRHVRDRLAARIEHFLAADSSSASDDAVGPDLGVRGSGR